MLLALFALSSTALSTGTVRWTGGTNTNWATAANWTVVSGTPSTPPGPGDAVQIGTGAITNQPTLSAATTIATLTYGNSAASTLTLNANLTVTGAVTNTIATTARIHNINLASGDTLFAGSANLSPAVAAGNMTITFNGGAIIVSGNFTSQPTTATTTITLTVGTGTFSVGGTTLQGAGGATARNCVINATTGTLIFSGAYTKDGSGSTLTTSGASNVSFGGNITNTTGTFTLNAATTTTLTGTGTITPTTAITLGHLAINTGVTATLASGTTTVAGNLIVNGTGNLGGAGTGALTLSGAAATIDGNGTIAAATTVSAAHSFLSSANLTLSGTWTINTGITLTNNGTVTSTATGGIVGGAASATWTNAANSTLNVAGPLLATGTLTATANPNTVDYDSTTALTNVKGATYYNLVFDKTGVTSAISANTTVNGNLTVNAGTLNFGAFTTVVTGLTSVSGTLGITSTTGTKTFGNVTINSGGTFNCTAAETNTINGDLTVAGGTVTGTSTGIFNVSGNFSVPSGTSTLGRATITVTGTTDITGTLNITSATGTKTFAGKLTIDNGATWNNSANSAITLQGGIENDGTFTTGTGTYTLSTNSQVVSGSSAINFGGIVAITGAITITNRDSVGVTMTGNLTGSVAGSTWLNDTNSTLNAGNAVLTTGTLTATANPNTVIYSGGVAQTIKATTYNDLTIAKSANTATLGGNTTVNGVFKVSSGTAAIGAFTFSVGDTSNISGTLNITSATGTKTFAGPVIINTGGVWNNSGNEAITLQAGLTHNGTTFTAGTGIYTFDTNSQSIGGSSAISIPSITVNVVTLTNNGNLTVTTALAGSGGLTNASNDTLNINFTGAPAITTLTASSIGNTVNYGFAGTQTIKVPASSTYYNLNLSSSGVKTAGGPLVVSGDLTLAGSASLNGGTSLTHTFAGNWILNTTAATPFTYTTRSTVNFNTPFSPAQTSLGGSGTAATITFDTVNVGNTSGFALSKNMTATGMVTVNAGVTLIPGASNTVGGTGTLTGSGIVKVTRTAATPDFLSQYTITNKTLTALTVDYDATAAQTVDALGYFNLTIEGNRGAASVTLGSGSVGVSGTFNPIATFSSGGYVTTGNTIDFNGSGAQNVPAFSYNNLTLSNAGTKTFASGTEGIAGVFTVSGTATGDATSNPTTVDYNGSAAQAIVAMNYTNLSLSNAGLKTFAGATTGVAGNLTISGGASADATTNSSTIDFNGGGSQNVAAINYSSLSFSNAGTKTLLSGTTRVASAFTLAGTAVADDTTNATTVEYNGTANQTAAAITYYNLVINNSGGNGRVNVYNVTVNNNLTVLLGHAQIANQNLTVFGTTVLNGELRITGSNGVKTLGDIVINSGGLINFNNADGNIAVNGNLQVNTGGSITSGHGLWTFQKSGGGTISGTAASTSIFDATFTTNYANSGSYDFGNMVVSGATFSNNGTIQVDSSLTGSGTLTQGTGATLNLNFAGSVGLSSLNTAASGNTVNYSAAGGQTVLATDYGNLTFSGSGIKTFSTGTTRIAGTFSISGATADATSNTTVVEYNGSGAQPVTATSYDNLTLSNVGMKTFASGTTNIAGNFTITALGGVDDTTNSPTIVYNGTAIQNAPSLTYYNLTLNNSSGIALSGNSTVKDTLTLTNGTITTASYKVSMRSGAVVLRTNGYINGNLEKVVTVASPSPTFEIGDATSYTPVNLAFAGVSGQGTFIARTTAGDHPQILSSQISPSRSVNRYWTLANNSVGFSTYSATFNFVAADTDAGVNPSAFLVDRYKSGTWIHPTIGTRTSLSTQATGITDDGDFQVGDTVVATVLVWDGGAGTHNWEDANNWNPNGVPTSNNNVNLVGADSININAADSVKSITLNNSALIVTIMSGGSLSVGGDLSMAAGTFNIRTSFPSVIGSVNLSGGTLGYTATGAQGVAAQSYYNLNLTGTGARTFATGTTHIAGDMIVGGVTADATTNSTTINYNGGGSQAVGPINYYNLSLSNSGTKTIAAGMVGVAGAFSVSGSASADATSNATTVDYDGSGSQTVLAINYHHLSLSNSGTKTFDAGTTGIAGNLTVSGSASADAVTNGTTIDYNGGSSQTVGAINYSNLTLSNNGTKTFSAGTTGIAGTLAVTGFASANAIANYTTVDYDGSSNQTVGAVNYYNLTLSNSGTKTFASGTTGIEGVLSISGSASADAISNVTTIDYNGAGTQSVAQMGYDNLVFSNSGIRQFASDTTTIAGDLTVSGTDTIDATTNASSIVLNGPGSQALAAADYVNLIFGNGGTKTVGAGTTRISGVFTVTGATADLTTNSTTFEFNGSGSQDAPSITYYNLICSNTGTRFLVNNVTVNHDFTVNVGQARVTNSSLTVTGTTTLNGELRVTSTGGAKTLGSIVVNTSGNLNFTANESLTLNGGLTVNGGGNVSSGSGTWTFQKTGGGTLGGTSPAVSITNAVFSTAYSNSGNFNFGTVTVTGTTFTNNGTVTVSTGLTGSGTFAQGTNATLNYNATSDVGVSTFNANASGNIVNYGATGAQSPEVADYYNLTFSGSSTKTFGFGTTRIAGAFAVSGSATADALTSTPTIEFNGTSTQSVTGLDCYNVTVNNANGISLTGNMDVGHTLTFTSGTITTGSDTVRMNSGATVSRTSGHVVGNFAKAVGTGAPTVNFELGDASGNYTPVMTSFTGVTVGGTLVASTTSGDHPHILTSGIEPSKTANRYWTLSGTGITYTNYDVTLNFVSGDLDAGANTSAFIVGRYQDTAWSLPTVGTLTSTSSQATGVVGFGDFQVGEQATAVLKTWDGGASTNNWGDANNWNPNGVPTSSNNVSLTGANTININVAATVNSITLNNGSLIVTIQPGDSLSVSGDLIMANGMLNTQGAFPKVTGTVTLSGGTVGYTATGAQSISVQSYYHLTLSGGGTKTFGPDTTSIAGDFTLGGSATADATSNSTTIVYNGPGGQAVEGINYHNLVLSNAGTKTLASGTVGIANSLTITGTAAVDATTNADTVNYDGSGAQTVQAINYNSLVFSNNGTKTFAADTTGIAGSLAVSGSATANATTNATTINYNGTGSQVVGAINYRNLRLSNAGTKTLATGTTFIAGDFSTSGTATGDAATNSTTVNFNGSSAQNIAAASFYNLTLSNGSTKILDSGTTSISGSLSVSGGASLDAVGNGTTIDFNGAAQAIPAVIFNNVSFSNSGTKTLASDTTTINGNVTISGTATVDATTNSSTVEFKSTSLQSVSPMTFYNLVIYKVSNHLTLNDLVVNHDFTIRAGEGRITSGAFTVNGMTNISEIFRVSTASAVLTFGDIVVNNGGQIIFASNAPMTMNGSLEVDGTGSITSGTGLWTFQKSGGGGILSGTAASTTITNATFTTSYTNSGTFGFTTLTLGSGTLTNNGTLSVGTGGLTVSSGAALTNGNSASITVTGADFTNDGTVTNNGTITVQ